jgi:hypothetical protein
MFGSRVDAKDNHSNSCNAMLIVWDWKGFLTNLLFTVLHLPLIERGLVWFSSHLKCHQRATHIF